MIAPVWTSSDWGLLRPCGEQGDFAVMQWFKTINFSSPQWFPCSNLWGLFLGALCMNTLTGFAWIFPWTEQHCPSVIHFPKKHENATTEVWLSIRLCRASCSNSEANKTSSMMASMASHDPLISSRLSTLLICCALCPLVSSLPACDAGLGLIQKSPLLRRIEHEVQQDTKQPRLWLDFVSEICSVYNVYNVQPVQGSDVNIAWKRCTCQEFSLMSDSENHSQDHIKMTWWCLRTRV